MKYARQLTLEECPKLDIRRLKKANLLVDNSRFEWVLDFEPEEIFIRGWKLPDSLYVEFDDTHQNITLVLSPKHKIPYAICPACNKQFAHLYLRGFFACRTCHSLSYSSWQVLHTAERAELRCGNMRKRLGWEPGLLNPIGKRPPGMQARDFNNTVKHYLKCRYTLLGEYGT